MKKQYAPYFWTHYARPFVQKIIRYAQRNLSFREWVAIAAVAYLLLPLIFYFGLYRFQNSEIHRLQQQTQGTVAPNITPQTTTETKDMQDRLQNLQHYKNATKESAFSAIEDLIIAHKLTSLEDTLLKISEPISEKNKYTAYAFTITLSGKYSDIGEFLFSIYQLPVVITPITVTVTPEEGSSDTVLHADMTLYIYHGASL